MDKAGSKKQNNMSLVNSYEVTMLENVHANKDEATLTDAKMKICFQTFDNIIPNLGMFQKVVKALRDDLFDGVYSHQYTTNLSEKDAQSICRVPYFTLVNRVQGQRDEKAEELRKTISELEEINSNLHLTINEKDEEIATLSGSIEKQNDTIDRLQKDLKMERDAVKRLQESLEDLKEAKDNMERYYENEIKDFKIELQASAEECKTLHIFKDNYDKLQDAFENPYLSTTTNYGTTNLNGNLDEDVVKNPRLEQVRKDLSVMETLENQLYYIRNCAMQEYDDFIESNKKEREYSDASSSLFKEIFSAKDDAEIEHESRELARTQRIFTNAMLDIKEELKLLFQHREVLQVELSKLEEDEVNRKEARKHKTESTKTKSNDGSASLEEIDLVEIMTGNTEDPFIPHENILNKYSSMIYTSCNEGKTFYEMPETSFCETCGLKTLICPHTVTEKERIFNLPRNCTHIKIMRPEIKLRRKKRRKKTQHRKKAANENDLLPRIKLIWGDFKTRTDVERKLERSLTEEYIISIINQFYALMIWQDDYQSTEEEPKSILNSFYDFLEDRFLLDDVIYLVFHDILTAVEKYAYTNKQVHLFAACLDGTVDAAAFRYVLLMTEFIKAFEWTQMQDFTSFVSIIYPFLTEDDLEQLRMGYTAFSENKVSPYLVFNYLLYIILNGREPRFLELEVKLLQCPIRIPGYYTDIEFAEAMDSIVPLASEKLLHRLFAQAVKHFPDAGETVCVGRISHIASYLSLIHNTPRINNSIKKWKEEQKQTLIASQEAKAAHQQAKSSRHFPNLVTLSKIKALGAEIQRRVKARKNQEEQDRLEMGFDELDLEDPLSGDST